MQSKKTKPSATSFIYFQVHDGARGTCRPPTVHSMNSFICGLERTIPKMGSRNFHLLFISNKQCELQDLWWYDLWITHENSKLTKHVDLTYDFCRRNTRPPCPPTTPSAVSASRSAAPYAKAPFPGRELTYSTREVGWFFTNPSETYVTQNGNLLPNFRHVSLNHHLVQNCS